MGQPDDYIFREIISSEFGGQPDRLPYRPDSYFIFPEILIPDFLALMILFFAEFGGQPDSPW